MTSSLSQQNSTILRCRRARLCSTREQPGHSQGWARPFAGLGPPTAESFISRNHPILSLRLKTRGVAREGDVSLSLQATVRSIRICPGNSTGFPRVSQARGRYGQGVPPRCNWGIRFTSIRISPVDGECPDEPKPRLGSRGPSAGPFSVFYHLQNIHQGGLWPSLTPGAGNG